MLNSERKPIPAGVGRGLQTRCALRLVVQVSSTLTGFRHKILFRSKRPLADPKSGDLRNFVFSLLADPPNSPSCVRCFAENRTM